MLQNPNPPSATSDTPAALDLTAGEGVWPGVPKWLEAFGPLLPVAHVLFRYFEPVAGWVGVEEAYRGLDKHLFPADLLRSKPASPPTCRRG